MRMEIERVWNGFQVTTGYSQKEVYKTLEEVIQRLKEIFK